MNNLSNLNIPENPVFGLRYGDRNLYFYLAFVPDTIS